MPKGWNDKLSSFRIAGGTLVQNECSSYFLIAAPDPRGVVGQPTAPPAAAPDAGGQPAPPAAGGADHPSGPSLSNVPIAQKLPGAVQNAVYDKAQVHYDLFAYQSQNIERNFLYIRASTFTALTLAMC